MELIKAQEQLIKDTVAILEDCGFINGRSIEQRSGQIAFYNLSRPSPIPKTAKTYITWEIAYLEAYGRADKNPLAYDSASQIDIWTQLFENNPELLQVLKSIEENAKKHGYELQIVNTADLYPNANYIHHSYQIEKVIHFDDLDEELKGD